MKLKSVTISLLICAISLSINCYSQWSSNPAINNQICTAVDDQFTNSYQGVTYQTCITSDGSGGAIIVWEDYRNGTNSDIYAQRINASGVIQWTTDGVAICNSPFGQSNPTITSDSMGGAIIAWADFRDGFYDKIYAQRIDANGIIQWTTNGVPICMAAREKLQPCITSDGNGGAIIGWTDERDFDRDIYVQRINSLGVVQWIADGQFITLGGNDQDWPSITSDGFGGAVITWEDNRTPFPNDIDIYAQRIDANGNFLWTSLGVPTCNWSQKQTVPNLVSDGNGGAIITWEDWRTGVYPDIYAQRINSSGSIQWTTDGVMICTATLGQWDPDIIMDGSLGAIITWSDARGGVNSLDIYSQRINSTGLVQWATGGVAVCTAANYQLVPSMTSDGSGGAIISWADSRAGASFSFYDIYAQHISNFGNMLWQSDGVQVSIAADGQHEPHIISDNSGGAIITWTDKRSSTNNDIYAQRIYYNVGLEESSSIFKPIFPNPTNGVISLTASTDGIQQVTIYNLLGEIVLMKEANLDAGIPINIDLTVQPPGIYIIRAGRWAEKIIKN